MTIPSSANVLGLELKYEQRPLEVNFNLENNDVEGTELIHSILPSYRQIFNEEEKDANEKFIPKFRQR